MSAQEQKAKTPRLLVIGSTGRIGSRVVAEIGKVDAVEAMFVALARASRRLAQGRQGRSSTSTSLKLSRRLLPE
jgi:hypothetical protein